MKYLLSLLYLLSLSAWAEIPLEDFAKNGKYLDAVISPTGEYLAVSTVDQDGGGSIAVLRLSDKKWMTNVGLKPKQTIATDLFWANDERVMWKKAKIYPADSKYYYRFGYFAMNYNGKKQEKLLADNVRGGIPNVLHLLPEKKEHILVSFDAYYQVNAARQNINKLDAYLLNIYTGKAKHITKSPKDFAYFLTNQEGDITYSFGSKRINKEYTYYIHKYIDEKWVQVKEIPPEDSEYMEPIASDNEDLIVRKESADKTDAYYKINIDTQKETLIYRNDNVDPDFIQWRNDTLKPFAVHTHDHFPGVHLLDKNDEIGKWYPYMQKKFPGHRVYISGTTDDLSTFSVSVSSDTNPGSYYLFTPKDKKFYFLFDAAPWLKEDQLSLMDPYKFKNRDGNIVRGYITKPKNKTKGSPMVVMPHGGPHGVRDYWGYDSDAQALASRGYTVLQVNYHGSSGYGDSFEDAGYQKWGSLIQHDIIDATRWAIKKGYADPERICIYGASFGGYSALMAPTIEPDLYKCAVGYVGIYDLNLMWKKGDIQDRDSGQTYLTDAIGKDKEQLSKFSPIDNLDKLKAPVFLVHGKKDERAHIAHYYAMKKALEKKGHPLETMLKPKEGHGFSKKENRIELYERLIAFLDKHIGK